MTGSATARWATTVSAALAAAPSAPTGTAQRCRRSRPATLSPVTNEPEPLFTLDEARALLAAVRDVAPDGLRAPLSRDDVNAAMSAGIEVKGVAEGLLDFPAEIEGVAAYWCWRAGEEDIAWWHPRGTGFAGRRPVPGAG
jgi:hypothetical protein